MRLIEDAKHWWKFWSVHLQILALAIQGWMIIDPVSLLAGMNMMPAHVRNALPESAVQIVTGVLFFLSLATILARNVRQPRLEKSDG